MSKNSLIDLKDKKVLLRVDFNVPIKDLQIQDMTRIYESIATIQLLKNNNNKVVICSHLGRPDLEQDLESEYNQELSFKHYIEQIEAVIGYKIRFINKYLSSDLTICLENQNSDEICLLENTRFLEEEENCDLEFSQKLASGFEAFVFDAFAVAHRKHATSFGVGKFLTSYKGLLVERESNGLDLVIKNPKPEIVLVVGGAKIMTKIGVIETFLDKADYVCVGGALANTFLYALGYEMGQSLVEKEAVEVAIKIINKAKNSRAELILPIDIKNQDGKDVSVMTLQSQDNALDIGVLTVGRFENIIRKCKTVIFNGPMGVFKKNEFSHGTESILNTIADLDEATTVLGGGDTLEALNKFAIDPNFYTLVSTGGGAMLEYLEKNGLEVIESIEN